MPPAHSLSEAIKVRIGIDRQNLEDGEIKTMAFLKSLITLTSSLYFFIS